ncbi:hypothetical protein AAP_03661 [Ascosphaera apis ARSEF 7405]|uniref:Uncharacterized protein n=1 Tax=Ascosphaera apis ARSEF 7405 TaxID=392613 RepID=A0A166NMJ9_9EURO|nr:hypothetical protein AAP_03661 [Ascosphaera apis ARSEF 7405]
MGPARPRCDTTSSAKLEQNDPVDSLWRTHDGGGLTWAALCAIEVSRKREIVPKNARKQNKMKNEEDRRRAWDNCKECCFSYEDERDRDEKDVALQTRTRQIIQCRSTEPECYCTLELLRASYTQVQGILDTRLVRIDKSSRFGSVY